MIPNSQVHRCFSRVENLVRRSNGHAGTERPGRLGGNYLYVFMIQIREKS